MFESLMKHFPILQTWSQALLNFFFPRYCPICGEILYHPQMVLCVSCDIKLPRTRQHLQPDNEMEKMFWGKIPLARAASYFYYSRGSQNDRIIHQFKYRGQKELARQIARMAACELQPSGFFQGIDYLIPVPLHPEREKQRGYNQSEWLAKGLSDITGIPVCTHWVERTLSTETQTRKSAYERRHNMQHVFSLLANPAELSGKHLLLIDDVLTTGATLTACAEVFCNIENLQISIFTLAQTRG